jgi:hypothetical protein
MPRWPPAVPARWVPPGRSRGFEISKLLSQSGDTLAMTVRLPGRSGEPRGPRYSDGDRDATGGDGADERQDAGGIDAFSCTVRSAC